MLTSPPTLAHLSRMYHELAVLGARAVGARRPWSYRIKQREEILALAADMSRYDPRLLDILVEFFYFHWQSFNPLWLRRSLAKMQYPQTLAVVSSFVAHADEINAEYVCMHEYLTRGLHPVKAELYFLNLYGPASHSMQRAAEEPVQEFEEWGFLARERPVLHDFQRKVLGHWGPRARQNMILRLVQKKHQITLADYLNCVEYTISRQQALLDLKSSPHLRMRGRGRGSAWVQRTPPH